ncbi:MAG: hypothetical protein IT350_00410 [Deltaproteobacteria bacterium]|nr:hypothetical protein [Deltaproteobacteria bacterium]
MENFDIFYVESGSRIEISLRGLKGVVAELSKLILDSWIRIRHRKIEDSLAKNEAILGSLAVIEKIDDMQQKGKLEHESAFQMKHAIIKSVLALFEAGVLPRVASGNELIDNRKLLESNKPKLLNAAPPDGDENSLNNIKASAKSLRRGKKKATSETME